MQLYPGGKKIFGGNLKTKGILALVEKLPALSILILEAIDELHQRDPDGNRAIVEDLFAQYRNARSDDLAFELKDLAEKYGLMPAEGEEDEDEDEDEDDDEDVDEREDEIRRNAAGIRHSKVDERMLAQVLNDEYDMEKESPMMLYGYSVAASRGLSLLQRGELLEDFMLKATIKAGFTEEYRLKWGAPRTSVRKEQMLSHIAWLIRTREAQDAEKYEAAIAKWEADAAQLGALRWTRTRQK